MSNLIRICVYLVIIVVALKLCMCDRTVCRSLQEVDDSEICAGQTVFLQGPPGPKGDKVYKCAGGVLVRKICYTLPYRVGQRLTFQDAKQLCEFQGRQLAEILDEEIYNATYDYVKTTWSYEINQPDATGIGIWIDGTAVLSNGSIELEHGRRGFASWQGEFPKRDKSSADRIVLRVPTSPRNGPANHGMWNADSSTKAVPLCQFHVLVDEL